jgi:hypothetical protein
MADCSRARLSAANGNGNLASPQAATPVAVANAAELSAGALNLDALLDAHSAGNALFSQDSLEGQNPGA